MLKAALTKFKLVLFSNISFFVLFLFSSAIIVWNTLGLYSPPSNDLLIKLHLFCFSMGGAVIAALILKARVSKSVLGKYAVLLDSIWIFSGVLGIILQIISLHISKLEDSLHENLTELEASSALTFTAKMGLTTICYPNDSISKSDFLIRSICTLNSQVYSNKKAETLRLLNSFKLDKHSSFMGLLNTEPNHTFEKIYSDKQNKANLLKIHKQLTICVVEILDKPLNKVKIVPLLLFKNTSEMLSATYYLINTHQIDNYDTLKEYLNKNINYTYNYFEWQFKDNADGTFTIPSPIGTSEPAGNSYFNSCRITSWNAEKHRLVIDMPPGEVRSLDALERIIYTLNIPLTQNLDKEVAIYKAYINLKTISESTFSLLTNENSKALGFILLGMAAGLRIAKIYYDLSKK